MENRSVLRDDADMSVRWTLALLGLTVCVSEALAQEASGFAALRTARKVSDGAGLVEMTGDRGEPRPQEWKVLFSDPKARGGVREVTVAGGVVAAERTPLRGYAGVGARPQISISRLNVDSDAAFQTANQQARDRLVGFHWADYTLRADNVTGVAVWVLRLYNHMGVQVGVIHISAEDGSVVMPLDVSEHPPTEQSGGAMENTPTGRQIGGLIGTVGGVLENTANKVKNTTLRTVGTVQEVLTGERTIGPQDEDE